MPKSSTLSGGVFVPRREHSRLALIFWFLEHACAVAGVAASGWPSYVKFSVVVLTAASLWLTRPPRSVMLVVCASGEWAVPEHALNGLRLLPGTTFTRSWALLRFALPDGRRRYFPVWTDTFSTDDWRRLSIRLREHVAGGETLHGGGAAVR